MLLTEEQKQRIRDSVLLAAVGDAMGYNNGKWEFCTSGPLIWKQLCDQFGQVENLDIESFIVSDDTVMHKGTIWGLAQPNLKLKNDKCEAYDFVTLIKNILEGYVRYWKEMPGRAPGANTSLGLKQAQTLGWDKVEYNEKGGGSGGSMRAMGIGLFFHGEKNREMLVKVGIEAGRLTHNNAIGYLGSLASAAFTAFAFEKIAPKKWGRLFMDTIIPMAYEYVLGSSEREVNEETHEILQEDFNKFAKKWFSYLKQRGIYELKSSDNESTYSIFKGNAWDGSDFEVIGELQFPEKYDFEERDIQYGNWSARGWGGASGHDSVIIAYDAFLGCKGNWIELVKRGVIHGGDNDSTGTICCAMFGAYYGMAASKVPEPNYAKIEMKAEIMGLAEQMIERMGKYE